MANEATSGLILFIASVLVAMATAGVLAGVILDLTDGVSERGDKLAERLSSEVRIVNDPNNVPVDPETKFYVQNVGERTIDIETAVVLVDGAAVTVTSSLLEGETEFAPGVIAQLTYATSLGAGDHAVHVIFENGVSDTMNFRV